MDSQEIASLAALGPVALWLLLVGFFSPLAISVIQQAKWTPRTRSLVAFAFYVVVAAVTAYLQGIFNTTGIIVAILVIFVTAGNAYKLLWQPTGAAQAIESVTPPNPAPPTQPRHSSETDIGAGDL
jgi:fatty acid desaturase